MNSRPSAGEETHVTRKSTQRVRKSSRRNAPARIRNRTKRRKAGKHKNVRAR